MAAARGDGRWRGGVDTWRNPCRQSRDETSSGFHDTPETGSSFLTWEFPIQQGPSGLPAPAPLYSGNVLSDDPIWGTNQTFSGEVDSGLGYSDANSGYSVGARGFFVPQSQQGRLFREDPVGYHTNSTATEYDSFYDTRPTMNHNQITDQWNHQELAAVAGQSFTETSMYTQRNSGDTGQVLESQLPAAMSLDAMHHPWSTINVYSSRADAGPWHSTLEYRPGEETANHPTTAYGGAFSAINGTGTASSDLAWLDPVTDETEGNNLGQSALTAGMKYLEHKAHTNNSSDANWQRQRFTDFQYNVHEGSPSRDNNDDEAVATSQQLSYDNESRYLAPRSSSYSKSVASSLESDMRARSSASCSSDVLSCSVPDCGTKFRGSHRKGSFNRHRRLYHQPEGVKLYPCIHPLCEDVFKRQDARLKHHRKRHPELGEDEPVLRRRQHETQDQVLRDISGWTGPMNDESHLH